MNYSLHCPLDNSVLVTILADIKNRAEAEAIVSAHAQLGQLGALCRVLLANSSQCAALRHDSSELESDFKQGHAGEFAAREFAAVSVLSYEMESVIQKRQRIMLKRIDSILSILGLIQVRKMRCFCACHCN